MAHKFQLSTRQVSTVKKSIKEDWALWVWAVVLLLINLPVFWGSVRTGLIFRTDAVLAGQWWRVVTHPLVHLTWYHLLLDAGGFLILYSCLAESRRWARWLYVIGPGAGALLFAVFLDSSVVFRGFCGLSGIAHGLMAVTALEMIGETDRKLRLWGAFSLLTVVVKSAYELYAGQVVFGFMHMGLCGQPIAVSHAGGVVAGLLAYATTQLASCLPVPIPGFQIKVSSGSGG